MSSKTKIKLLILSRTAWRDDNSFGSSFSSIFGDMDNIEIANIFCNSALPNSKVASRFFQITEKRLIKNFINNKKTTGKVVQVSDGLLENTPSLIENKEQKIFRFFQKNRFQIFMWFREFIWYFGNWKSKELNKFIDDFSPDLIFLPVYISPYMNRIGLYLKNYSEKKMVGYISDDNYTLKQYSLNPFFWIDRLINRRFVKKAIDNCEILYVISEVQKKDYDIIFNKECKVLFKGADFENKELITYNINNPVKLLFTGNIGAGRYKTLALIGDALDEINKIRIKAIIEIYSQIPLNSDMRAKLLNHKSILFAGPISQEEVLRKQNESDILVHVESFDLKEKLLVRQSFSTKIVDYLHRGRCIFAVGGKGTASIDYLQDHEAAIVANNSLEIELKLKELLNSPEKILIYGNKAWECGKKNHRIKNIQDGLIKDFNSLLN